MSRIESHDSYDFPPGLGFTPRPGTNIHNYHQSSVTPLGEFPPVDRRGSLSMGYSTFYPLHSSVPRSIGGQDQEYGIFGNGDNWSPPTNRHNPSLQVQPQHLSSISHHHRHTPGVPAAAGNNFYNPPPYNDRDGHYLRNGSNPCPPSNQSFSNQPVVPAAPAAISNPATTRSTLYWGDLEPWMDEEWAKRVCGMMNWDPNNIKVPHPQPDPVTGQQANNPGYCFLTFPSRAHAERVMNQVNPSNGGPITMPNSTRPFNITWASSLPSSPLSASFPTAGSSVPGAQQQFPKEYSIFVGDLAPETSNSDLVAVFRNPVLGLRNDREPKFIRPFLSCKSAKIMLDPVTGVSRGYGFVRFTDEADQQRALIEMHGLYCLSRPMRISPATAKFKPPSTVPSVDIPQVHTPSPGSANGQDQSQSVTIAVPLPTNTPTKSVSAPIAATTSSASNSSFGNPVSSSGSGSSIATSSSVPSLSSSSTTSISSALASATSEELLKLPQGVLSQLAQYANNVKGNIGSDFAQVLQQQNSENGQQYGVSEESWKHHIQARAILGNLIGPNGEQLTSTDPYNTTVFVGGLSPLIGEDTLRSFFAPFGEIHYVKVPVGKHCGFVQFVRKADAERAIEQMQGFPIGGSRIRLSWGRSQYKAAQAAAQAAQSSALQAQLQTPAAPAPAAQPQLSPEQAVQLLQRLGLGGILDTQSNGVPEARGHENSTNNSFGDGHVTGGFDRDGKPRFMSGMMEPRQNRLQKESNFSPFSPDPNLYEKNNMHPPSKHYAGFGSLPLHSHDSKAVGGPNGNGGKISPTSFRPPSASQRFGSSYFDETRRHEAPISRPNSGTPSNGNGQAAQHGGKDHDGISDFNGTLASLDLDPQTMWKSSKGDSYNADVYAQYKTATSNGGTPSP